MCGTFSHKRKTHSHNGIKTEDAGDIKVTTKSLHFRTIFYINKMCNDHFLSYCNVFKSGAIEWLVHPRKTFKLIPFR